MAGEERQGLSSFITCDLCKKIYTEPKLLKCLHTFCLECLIGLRATNTPKNAVNCPSCGKPTSLNDECLTSLTDNDFMQRLITMESLRNPNETSTPATCCACRRTSSEANQLEPAAAYCIECEEQLCESCCNAHRKIKVTAYHRLIKLDDLDKFKETIDCKPTTCVQHPAQAYTLYCREPGCMIPVCLMCVVLSHKSHDYTDLAVVTREFRDKLHCSVIEGLAAKRDRYQRQAEAIDRTSKDLEINTDSIKGEISQWATKLHQLIDRGGEILLSSVHSYRRDKEKELQLCKKEIQDNATKLASFLELCRQLNENGSHVEICSMYEKILAKADELNTVDDVRVPHVNKAQFTSNDEVAEMLSTSVSFGAISTEMVIGSITDTEMADENNSSDNSDNTSSNVPGLTGDHTSDPSKNECKTDATMEQEVPPVDTMAAAAHDDDPLSAPLSLASRKLDTPEKSIEPTEVNFQLPPTTTNSGAPVSPHYIQRGTPVRGIAVYGRFLYVIHNHSATIDAYCRDTLELSLSETLTVVGIKDSSDLAICKLNKCLYTCDYHQTIAFRISLSDKKTLASKQLTSLPRALSVTTTGDVLVSFPRAHCLVEFTTDWQVVRTVHVPDFSPSHAIQLTEDEFVICGSTVKSMKCAVMKLKVAQSSGNQVIFNPISIVLYDGNEHGLKLKHLTHIAVATNESIIYVVDAHSHTVLALNSELNMCRQALGKDKINGLYKICLNSRNTRMYIGITNQHFCKKSVFKLYAF